MVHSVLPATLTFPAGQLKHPPSASCRFAAVPGSLRYFPAAHAVQIASAEVDHLPAEQIKHFPIPLWYCGAVPESLRYVPATQSVQTTGPVVTPTGDVNVSLTSFVLSEEDGPLHGPK
jgi:hypothetical protein